jgi:hypothetical protein
MGRQPANFVPVDAKSTTSGTKPSPSDALVRQATSAALEGTKSSPRAGTLNRPVQTGNFVADWATAAG